MSRPTIYVYLYGRMGNLMFQVAQAATLAERTGADIVGFVNEHYYCPEPDNCFLSKYIEQFKDNLFHNLKFVTSIPEGPCAPITTKEQYDNYHGQCNAFYNMGVFAFKHNGQRLVDADVAQKMFAITDEMRSYIYSRYPMLKSGVWTSVLVRRGDYVKFPEMASIITSDYVNNALKISKVSGGVFDCF